MALSTREYYYNNYGSDNLWDQKVNLSYKWFTHSDQKLFIASFAFECLTFLALITFLVWACTIRPSNQPLKGVIAAIVMWIVAQLLTLIYEILELASAVVKQYYVIDFMLQELFQVISSCVLFLVFYQTIHLLLDRLTDSGKPYAFLRIIHWVVLGIIAVLSLADFALYVVVDYKEVEETLTLKLIENWRKLYSARTIIYFVVALEIFVWTIFVTVKAGTHRFASRLPLFSLMAGSLCWFGYNLMWGVVAIQYYLAIRYMTITADYLAILESVFGFVFVVGIFTGLLLCLKNSFKLGGGRDKAPTSVQHPYDSSPVFQTWQPRQQQQPQQQPVQP
ncbi:hypothetical protein N7486_006753 [Penicillium sp. IBT 16267x]|nr:hypothetical protein N7486_006753 [Penicillium sp. IBT 16267x]